MKYGYQQKIYVIAGFVLNSKFVPLNKKNLVQKGKQLLQNNVNKYKKDVLAKINKYI